MKYEINFKELTISSTFDAEDKAAYSNILDPGEEVPDGQLFRFNSKHELLAFLCSDFAHKDFEQVEILVLQNRITNTTGSAVLPIKEYARLKGVRRETVHVWISQGKLRPIKEGKNTFVILEEAP